ncbi:PREDICTED: putative late blight resistance protein homolog R1A-10 [Erythranthe guttata]|uniref:putative late blight resistance protein homolog R1A-10 n=1 Tax=Erythranthe guttata TaxID=4155 RepID=UPI00064DA8F9|nr:PREDICTED: putative late blight resistance protein homolog R1A-10 [Erythranthe guttata]|eukprot:XP_012854045.1 PREDICTED: putative late blight resistance protein homolog R1A-10 [Erythranthe guttata]
MRLLSKEESWHLLREKVFGKEGLCSYKLEKAGKKIAEKCEGLPLTIVTVGKVLLEAENKTWEYWNEVAEKQNSVFVDAYEQMYEVLFRSYENLPQHLKLCFLYMGVFLEKHEIIRSKLIDLWIADGILESYFYGSEYLEKLVSSSVAMALKQSYNGQTKTCSLHSTFWYLCNKEAAKSKFFYALNSIDDALEEGGIESQRRLCVRNNVLFGIKDVYDFVGSISTVRSLLCTGLYHQFPVPICFDLILLRVLDALTIRFYEFPLEVVKLVQLRYLALTSNGELHFSISKLSSLEYLIVHRHLDIVKSDKDSSYLPKEIWDMKELKYLHVMGSDIPNPWEKESLLPNLVTLLDASPQSCTRAVLERMPRLKKLGIRIESDGPFSFFDHISHLRELRSLKCVVANPFLESNRTSLLAPLSIFSSCLKKLSMSGFGYSWEEMKTIGLLPNLEVLKLRCYAFRGVKWETRKDGFAKLKFLSIEDTDLVQWTVERGSLPLLQFLSIKHCYKLKEIPRVILSTLRKIELVDCSSLVVRCAKGITEELLEKRYDLLEINVLSSWDDVKV